MKWRRLNNVLHRDLGFFLAGTTILYALSGLALNHAADWNPNFIIRRQSLQVDAPKDINSESRAWARSVLEPLGEEDHYRGHDFPSSNKVKIYLDDGSVFIDRMSGEAVYESVRRRPLFFQINCLHVSPKRAWLVFSDFFAVSLILLSATGLFVLRGRKGIAGRGAFFLAAGMLVPVAFMVLI